MHIPRLPFENSDSEGFEVQLDIWIFIKSPRGFIPSGSTVQALLFLGQHWSLNIPAVSQPGSDACQTSLLPKSHMTSTPSSCCKDGKRAHHKPVSEWKWHWEEASWFYRSYTTDPLKESGLAANIKASDHPSLLAALWKWARGFCRGPSNDLTTRGLSFPYSCDLPVGENTYLVSSNTFPLH